MEQEIWTQDWLDLATTGRLVCEQTLHCTQKHDTSIMTLRSTQIHIEQ